MYIRFSDIFTPCLFIGGSLIKSILEVTLYTVVIEFPICYSNIAEPFCIHWPWHSGMSMFITKKLECFTSQLVFFLAYEI